MFNIQNSTVLVRVCYDLSNLEDIDRIYDSQKTVQALLENQNKVILLSHWGRPKGSAEASKSFTQIVPILEKVFQQTVEYIDQYEGFGEAKEDIQSSDSQIFILENTRFHKQEQSKNPTERMEIAENYASLGVYLVDEAFAVSHRQEATNTELKELLPTFLGLSFENEIQNLQKVHTNVAKPFVVVMAGAKLETKLPLIEKMLPKVDKLLLGGMLCFTFIKAAKDLKIEKYEKVDLAQSSIEENFYSKAVELLQKYPEKIVLPVDLVYDVLDEKKLALDIGEQSLKLFEQYLSDAKSIFWNGTLGYYEKPPFDQGTLHLAEFVGNLQNCFKVIGGGDTNSSLPKEILQKFDFVSMGGGATLEFLAK